MQKAEKPISTLLDFVFKSLLASILIFIPLYPKFPLFSVPFTYVAIRAEDFLILSAVLVFALIVIRDRSRLHWPPLALPIGIFFVVVTLSSLSAILVTQNIQPLLALLHLFRRFEYIVVFFLFYFGSRVLQNRKFYLEIFYLPAALVFIYGIAQLYFGAPVISTMDSEASKGTALYLRPGVTLSSTFSGHYDLAVYLCMMISLLYANFITTSKKFLRFLAFFSLIPLGWLFMQTGSRISLGSLFVSLFVITLITRKYLHGFIVALLLGSLLLASPQFAGRFDSLLNVIKQKMQMSFVARPVYAVQALPTKVLPTPTPEVLRPIQNDRSTSIRFDVEWPRALRAFYKQPLLGTGYSSLTLATDNDYLRALGETGLLGFLSFIAILIGLLKYHLVKAFKYPHDYVTLWSLAVLIGFLITATFLDVFEASKIAILFWSIMGISFAHKP